MSTWVGGEERKMWGFFKKGFLVCLGWLCFFFNLKCMVTEH